MQLYMLMLASAVVTANAYYIHPIISLVAKDFGVSDAMIGLVPALNQIALAVGIFLLLPLGDRTGNRRLVSIFTAGQFVGIAVMAFASPFWLFTLGSTLLGFFTIAPYLLPAYVSKRVDPATLGNATALLTTGVIAGILVARVGAGIVGEYFGWRLVYYIAASLMLAVSILLPLIMDSGEAKQAEGSYWQLLGSLAALIRQSPDILIAGAIQALSFGVFLSIWLGLGLHLTSPEMGYGTDTVGYLALFALVNLTTTPFIGSWADKVGARKARVRLTAIQFVGVCLFAVFGWNLWLLMIPIVITNICGPCIDITSRMTFLSAAPSVRTRLMTIYIVCMFLGGGFASWAGTTLYDYAGWGGNSGLAAIMSGMVLALSYWSYRREKGVIIAPN
jgi:MFS family permease